MRYKNPQALAKAKQPDVEKIIRPVNYYRNKSRNIINCAKGISKEFKGKIPHNVDKLTTLAGVGRKTANVFLSEYGKDAIGVDTHVSYISQKLNWTNNKNPHKIESDLQNLFPRKYWSKVNSTLVRFGKSHTSRKEKDKLLEEIKKI
jgi:endonuclease-3